MRKLNKTDTYNVGITGNTELNLSSSVNNLIKKMMQIGNYCKRFNKTVVVYFDATLPLYLYKLIFSLGYSVKFVVKGSEESEINLYTENVSKLLDTRCSVVVILDKKENKEDYDYETDTVFIPVKKSTKEPTKGKVNPVDVIKNAKKFKAKQMGDPYSIFHHEPLYDIVPLNHWNELMDTKPEDRDPSDREFY